MQAQMGSGGSGSGSGRGMTAEGPAEARAGPRIFIGKLNKDTSENDVRVSAHCSQFKLRVDC